jgi:hypothetical protein
MNLVETERRFLQSLVKVSDKRRGKKLLLECSNSELQAIISSIFHFKAIELSEREKKCLGKFKRASQSLSLRNLSTPSLARPLLFKNFLLVKRIVAYTLFQHAVAGVCTVFASS